MVVRSGACVTSSTTSPISASIASGNSYLEKPSCHGYDITDYDSVEPRLGGDDALRALGDSAHRRGIRVLLDLVCNHVSNQHSIFLYAWNNADSAYRDWFDFDERLNHGYRCFFNVETMPEVNLEQPAAETG